MGLAELGKNDLFSRPAKRDIPKFIKVKESESREERLGDQGTRTEATEDTISKELSEKTDKLMEFIEKNYFTGKWSMENRGKHIIKKMRLAENSNKVQLPHSVETYSVTSL